MSQRLRGFLSVAAQTQGLALSPLIARVLWQSREVQHQLLDDEPKAVARQCTLDEIGLAHFGQLALATNSLDRLVLALEEGVRDASPVDALRIWEVAHAIEQQLERLQPLNVVRQRTVRETGS